MYKDLIEQDHALCVQDIAELLYKEQKITIQAKNQCLSHIAMMDQGDLTPLELIAKQNLDDITQPGKKFNLENLTSWLADLADQPYVRIDPLKIDVAKVTSVISYAFAKHNQILVIEATEDKVVIANIQPFVKGWQKSLQHVVKRQIERVMVNPSELRRLTNDFYKISTSVTGAKLESMGSTSSLGNFEQLVTLTGSADQKLNENDSKIIGIVDWLFQYAFQQRASDIHIEPRREGSSIRLRIDGILHTVYQLPLEIGIAAVNRVKALGRMNISERRRPQDGRIKTLSPSGDEIELRLSTLPTAFGEKMVMRIFDPSILLKGFADLGLSNDDYKRWHQMASQPNGIILVTGPTGSGKTTTLYTTLKQLATKEVNVCTIEDPIEMIEDSFNQMQVQHNIDLNFVAGIRALMRQDPDIIMVGEIRDLETAEMATQASLTGHLVLSTIHTNDAPSTITRLLELGVPYYLIKNTLLGVMAQRLIRTLCPHCKESTTIDEKTWARLTKPWRSEVPTTAMKAVGCHECRDTGYMGRMGIYEVMVLSDTLKSLILSDANTDIIRQQAYKEGMHSLRLSGAQKIAKGLTTVEEVLRVT